MPARPFHSSPLSKPVEWVGSALDDLRACPADVQDVIGYALWLVQLGLPIPGAKRLRGDLRGLVEIVDDDDGDTYRAVYTTRLAGVVYVLHVFQKKSTHGIATPRHEIDLIKQRLQRATQHHAMHYSKKGET